MSTVKVNTISTWTGSDISIETGKTVSGTASQFKMTDVVQGDVLYGSAADTINRLAKGTAAQVLSMNSGATAPEWAASAVGGKVLQVLEDNLNTTVSTTSTSYVASGLSIAITPASTSSKFLLTLLGGSFGNIDDGSAAFQTFYVGGSEVAETGPYEQHRDNHNGSGWSGHSAACLHSPSTTSALTYTVYYKANAYTAHFNNSADRVVFTVMEISS